MHLLALVPFLLASALLVLPNTASLQPTAIDYPSEVRWSGGSQDGRPIDLRALALPNGSGRVSLTFDLSPDAIASGPLGLRLSGPFSARATWNGLPIGDKGKPGASTDHEIPGPIDAELLIPAEVLRAGPNTLVLDLSANFYRAGGSIIHGPEGLSVRPFSADARRPLHTYLLPLMMIGALLAALVLIVQRTEARWPAVFISGLLIVAVAEISRSLINYPYPMHGWRAAAQYAGCVLAAIAMVQVAAQRAGLRERTNALVLTAALIVLISSAVQSTDPRATGVVWVGALVSLMLTAPGLLERRADAVRLALALSFILAFALLDPRAFLDRTLYAVALPLLAFFATRPAPVRPESRPTIGKLIIGGVKRRRVVAIDAIRAVHAADKYTEFELGSGERVLDETTLNEWAQRLPATFVRVHRSHIVNTARVGAVLVLGPGKYAAEMDDRSRIPLSRARVNDLRAAIGAGDLSMATPQG